MVMIPLLCGGQVHINQLTGKVNFLPTYSQGETAEEIEDSDLQEISYQKKQYRCICGLFCTTLSSLPHMLHFFPNI